MLWHGQRPWQCLAMAMGKAIAHVVAMGKAITHVGEEWGWYHSPYGRAPLRPPLPNPVGRWRSPDLTGGNFSGLRTLPEKFGKKFRKIRNFFTVAGRSPEVAGPRRKKSIFFFGPFGLVVVGDGNGIGFEGMVIDLIAYTLVMTLSLGLRSTKLPLMAH